MEEATNLLIIIFHLILITLPNFVLATGKHKPGWNNLYIILIYIGFFTLAVLVSILIRRYRTGVLGTHGDQLPVRASRGMDAEDIASLPSMRFSEIKLHKVAEQGQLECSVCLTEFKDDEILRLLPDCLHVFHPDCITPWLRTHVTCPVCRASLEHRQGSSVSTCSVLDEGISGTLSSELYLHAHGGDQHDHGDHVSTVEIEEMSSGQHVELDGVRGKRGLVKCYSTGDLAVRFFVGESSENASNSWSGSPKLSNQKKNCREIDGKSHKSDSFVDYSSLLLVNVTSD